MKVFVLKMHDQICQRTGFSMSKEDLIAQAYRYISQIEGILNVLDSKLGSDMTGP